MQTNIECSMVHRTENTACRTELGRYHLSIDIKASLLCYWQRLEQESDTTAISTEHTFIKLWIFFTETISENLWDGYLNEIYELRPRFRKSFHLQTSFLVGYLKKAHANLVYALYAFIKLFTINAVDKKVFGKLKIA